MSNVWLWLEIRLWTQTAIKDKDKTFKIKQMLREMFKLLVMRGQGRIQD